MADDKPTYSLLLVGMKGDGKSSTGNSILGKHVFDPVHANITQPHIIKHGETVIDGQRIHVVDGNDIGDTGKDLKVSEADLRESLDTTIWNGVSGFNAIVYVRKYGTRFTKQNKESVQYLKTLFGDDVFKKWGIMVTTYGNNLINTTNSFESWCLDQSGDFKYLYEECSRRCVLFDNRRMDDPSQRQELLKAVDDIMSSDDYVLYTRFIFKKHQASNNSKLDGKAEIAGQNSNINYKCNVSESTDVANPNNRGNHFFTEPPEVTSHCPNIPETSGRISHHSSNSSNPDVERGIPNPVQNDVTLKIKDGENISIKFLGFFVFLIFAFPAAYCVLDYFKVKTLTISLAFVCTAFGLIAITLICSLYFILRKSLASNSTSRYHKMS